ncbi:MAG: hypothetical protein ACRC42_04845 [Mycoplasma sp.]
MMTTSEWDWRNITLLTTILTCVIVIILLIVFNKKIGFFKKSYKKSIINTVSMIMGTIIGFGVVASNDFKIFSEGATSEFWYTDVLYTISGITGMILSILIIWYLLMLPLRYFVNITAIMDDKKALSKFLKISAFYSFFALVAMSVAMLQYFMKDPFFSFDSQFSFDREPVNFEKHPAIYVVGRMLFSYVLTDVQYTFYLIISIVIIVIIQMCTIVFMRRHHKIRLKKISNIFEKITNKAKITSFITPVLIFTSIISSLLTQPVGTFLHISTVIILMVTLTFVILLINSLYCLSTREVKFSKLLCIIKDGVYSSIKNSNTETVLNEVRKNKTFSAFQTLSSEHSAYNIFSTILFPIVITGYLGFCSGPLLQSNDITSHVFFWTSLFVMGYLLNFAYSFKSNNIVASKLMIASGTAFVVTGFNTGILNAFNPIINRLANFSTFTVYISISCHHLRKRRVNWNKKIKLKNNI